jgi:hypothetical protein
MPVEQLKISLGQCIIILEAELAELEKKADAYRVALDLLRKIQRARVATGSSQAIG